MSETVKSSFFTREMLHNAKMEILRQKKMMIVLTVLHLVGLPFVLIQMILKILSGHDFDSVAPYMAIGCITTAVALLAGISCAINSMPYLYKKTEVDTRLSLPMSTAQRFASDLMSGMFVYALPFLVSMALSWVLVLIGHLTCDGRTLYLEYTEPEKVEIFQQMAPYLFRAMITALVMMLLYYMMTVLVISCCGSLLEAIVYTVLINGLVPGVIAVTTAVCAMDLNGLEWDFYLQFALPFTSPLGAMIFAVPSIAEGPNSFIPFAVWALITVVIACVYGAVGYLAYFKRKAEDTGKPIVFGIFYDAIMTLALVSMIFLFISMDDDMILPAVIVTAVFYFVASVIRNRGFKRFGRSVIAYVVTAACCFAGYFIIEATGSFGAERHVPSASTVSCAYISYNGAEQADVTDFGGMFGGKPLDEITCITERDDIEMLLDLHRSVVEKGDMEDREWYGRDSHRYRVLYKLKSGSWMLRQYTLDDSEYSRLSELDDEPALRRVRVTEARSYLEYRTTGLYREDTKVLMLKGELSSYMFSDKYDQRIADGSKVVELKDLPNDFTEKFCQALENDVMNMSSEQYMRPDVKSYGLTSDGSSMGILVREDFTETMNYLFSMGFELPEDGIDAYSLIKNGSMSIASIPMMSVHNGGTVSLDHNCSRDAYRFGNEYNDPFYFTCITSLNSTDYFMPNTGDLERILSTSLRDVKGDPRVYGCEYVIVVDDKSYFVREDMTEQAKNIFVERYLAQEATRLVSDDRASVEDIRAFVDIYSVEIDDMFGEGMVEEIKGYIRTKE
ncbi:MAG: hypothetical protein IKR73_00440 [Oscillospiraceae bacterium]|nr:hypothetical protein [Oscillospiraceae bacterium]